MLDLRIILAVLMFACAPAVAAEPAKLTLKDHRFTPETLTVPSGQKIKIEIVNQDDTPEEFESHDLKVEKIVTPGGTITVTIGPLKSGSYRFFGEYHEDTATGTIVAAEASGKE
jgi:heme/copper-type cytochrome/quinol oxidase subunit 2